MDLNELAQTVVGWADDNEQVEVYVARGRDTDVVAYDGDIESLSSAESAGAGVRVVIDGRQGFAWAGSLDLELLGDALTDARDNAGFASPEEWVGLVEPDGVAVAELDLWNDALADVPDADKVTMALDLERMIRAADPRIKGVESASYADGMVEMAVASTTGIAGETRRATCHLSTYVLAGDDDETQTGFGFSVGRSVEELSAEKVRDDAVERATRLLGAVKPESSRTTVVLDPFVTAQLLAIIGGTLDAESVLKGRSLFADRVGDEVAAPSLTLVDDPTDARFLTAGVLDAEGLATRRNELIVDGVFCGFVHNSTTARRMGTSSTGSAVRGGFKSPPGVGCRALALTPGSLSRDELFAEVGDGVLVTSVSGLHSGVNPVSGDFSTGASGLRISGGQVGEPLREFTIASTLQRLLLDVRAVGSDLEFLPMSAAGLTLAVEGVTVSGR